MILTDLYNPIYREIVSRKTSVRVMCRLPIN